MAVVDVYHLVPHPRFVKPNPWAFDSRFAVYFLCGQPTLTGKRKFHFIAVVVVGWCCYDGIFFCGSYFANMGEIVGDLFFFKLKLCLIIKMLPFAATAQTKIVTRSINAIG